MPLHARISQAVAAAGEQAAHGLTERVRTRAVKAGWPPTSADKLVVKHHHGTFEATFEGAEDIEMGTQTQPPLSVARVFNTHIHHEADGLMNQALEHHLSGLL